MASNAKNPPKDTKSQGKAEPKAEAKAEVEASPASELVTVSREELNRMISEQVAGAVAQGGLNQLPGVGGPVGRSRADIEAWLDGEAEPDLLFAERWEMHMAIIPSRERYDRDSDSHETIMGVSIDFHQWQGVGAELRQPDNSRTFDWGYFRLLEHSQVVATKDEATAQDMYTLDEVWARVLESRYYQADMVFDAEAARLKLKNYYKAEWQRQSNQRLLEELRLSKIKGAEKSGRIAEAANA